MENKILTAEEILIKEEILLKTIEEGGNFPLNLTRDTHIGTAKNIKKAMISFAKLHVTEALKQAYQKAELKEQEKGDEQICFMANDMGDAYVLDKDSILNTYDLNNIK